jgi:DNA-binding transcriptional LysR family regulator
VHLRIAEHEPAEALGLLDGDEVDLVLTYDYSLAPTSFDRTVQATPLWSTPWALAVPDVAADASGPSTAVFTRYRDHGWIVNSRDTADEDVVRTIASIAGFAPRIAHRADSLDLVEDLIVAGLGVGLLPADRPTAPGVRLLPLTDPDVRMRAYAVTRAGRAVWPPLALVVGLLTQTQPPDCGISGTEESPTSRRDHETEDHGRPPEYRRPAPYR